MNWIHITAWIYLAIVVIALTWKLTKLLRLNKAAQHLLQHGRLEYAIVQSLEQTGRFINDNPECRLKLADVADPTHTRELEQILQVVEVPRAQPGSRVALRVDPVTDKALIDFSQAADVAA
ncbi:hypothetical protein [Andreprevotia chitinilytica]|uniref:hypothetical protein n=1 Tax=Andreprevotia chitinilytica TaxID=396808 RepID=UPI0005519BE7|nr:hypothetical protein [Andreprevotia chitinilytica]